MTLRPLALVVALLPAALPAPASAQDVDRSYAIESMSVRLELTPEGRYQVEEAISFRFQGGTFSQGFRSIPAGGVGAVEAVEVTSPETAVSEIEHRRSGRDHLIEWSFPDRAEPVTFVLRYEVEGALVSSEGENLIDWDAVGRAWEVPIEDVRVSVAWPDFGLGVDDIRIHPSAGSAFEPTGEGWLATFTPGAIDARTPYRVIVRFPERIEGRAPPERMNPAGLLVAFALFLLGLVPGIRAYRSDRNPREPEAGPDAEAPDLPLPEASFLANEGVYWTTRTFPAVLVRLARRGEVTLERVRETKADPRWWEGEGERERLKVEVNSRPEELTPFEQAFLAELSEHDSFHEFLADATRFRRQARREMREELVERGFMVDLRPRSGSRLMTAALIAIGATVLAILAPGVSAVWIVSLGLGGAIGFLVAATRRFRMTERGVRAQARVRSFQKRVRDEVLDAAERDPPAATSLLAEHLEWVLLDLGAFAWMHRLKRALEKAGAELPLPPWLARAVGHEDEEAMASFLAMQYFMVLSQPQGASATSTPGGASFSAGVGASGGIGGGGGGVR
jgi:hypothetical protein